MRPVFGGPTRTVLEKILQEIKDSLHTVHLPIKMQMRVGLWIRLCKQIEIKIGKKEEKQPVVSARKKENVGFRHSQRVKHLDNLKRNAKRSPQIPDTNLQHRRVCKEKLPCSLPSFLKPFR